MELTHRASRNLPLVQLATATIAFAAGSVAVLETFPRQPLFELQFIYSTVVFFAEMATAFGLAGLLLIPVTLHGLGRRQWVFVTSVLLASAGLSGGLWVLSLVGHAS
ncbi:MAG TPA: hypothetical protein VGA48_09920 [Thermoplasmata archaeon]